MASTPLPEQPFTFASPIPSETYEDALDFDYESWIEQSKISNCHSSHQHDKQLSMEDAEAINKNHTEMVLPEEAYEMSLRDLTELSLSRSATQEPVSRTRTNDSKPWRKKARSISMEGAGLVIKLFMHPPSRAAAATGRKKSFSRSTVTVPVNGGSMENATSEAGNEPSNTRSNSMPCKSYQECTNRKPMGCYPFFNSRKYKVKRVAGGHFCL